MVLTVTRSYDSVHESFGEEERRYVYARTFVVVDGNPSIPFGYQFRPGTEQKKK